MSSGRPKYQKTMLNIISANSNVEGSPGSGRSCNEREKQWRITKMTVLLSDKIHGEVRPRPVGSRQWHKLSWRESFGYFSLCTHGARGDIVINFVLHTWPSVFALQQFACPRSAGMSGACGCVSPRDHFTSCLSAYIFGIRWVFDWAMPWLGAPYFLVLFVQEPWAWSDYWRALGSAVSIRKGNSVRMQKFYQRYQNSKLIQWAL